MAMDPVSRRLAAAAMGLALGLSRDEELEKTRLDLERARMEREDFRNGAGPDTAFMHWKRDRNFPALWDEHYKGFLKAGETMRMLAAIESQTVYEAVENKNIARSLLARVVSEIHQRREVSDSTHNEIVDYLKADSSDEGMAEE